MRSFIAATIFVLSAGLAPALAATPTTMNPATAQASAAAAAKSVAANGAQTPVGIPAGVSPAPSYTNYPNMPTSWPDNNEARGGIAVPALLNHPLVQAGVALINKNVPQDLLNIPPALHIDPYSGTYYPSDEKANCYWPAGYGCHSPDKALNLQDDITMCPGPNVMGINYDDGPSDRTTAGGTSTLDLLDQLDAMKQKATFFVVGAMAHRAGGALQRIYKDGHEIAVHTWTHAPLTTLNNTQIVAEILYTEALVYYLTGARPAYFRPPYGDIDNRVRAIVNALGYHSVLWKDDRNTNDSDNGANQTSVLAQANSWLTPQAGFIDLEHSLSPATNDYAIALLKQIQSKQQAGTFPLKLQPIAECLGKSAYAANTTVAPVTNSTPVTNNTSNNNTTGTGNKPNSASSVSGSGALLLAAVAGLVALVGL
ncbi:chitin deacetylase [Rhizophlyctis rosea]|nr:chitin deacetylase [Rhizophlyctis rosea]